MTNITLAEKTLQAIEEVVFKDQGASYRGWLGKVISHVGDAYRDTKEDFRSHLGASLIGRTCAREIWYGFRWATKPSFQGRMVRLFNRGHLEEARFIALLLSIGCTIYQQDENGKQFRISAEEGHFGGSGDGVVIGLPDLAPGTPALAEFKTHSDKSFKELSAKGVKTAKFEHYIQMQVYMRKMGLAVALYLAVNKNTDELYGEMVALDTIIADQFLDRAAKIIWMKSPPEMINKSVGWFDCKFCDQKPVCKLKKEPEVNCRTCEFSSPVEEAQWHCSKNNSNIPKTIQLVGCGYYIKSSEL